MYRFGRADTTQSSWNRLFRVVSFQIVRVYENGLSSIDCQRDGSERFTDTVQRQNRNFTRFARSVKDANDSIAPVVLCR